MPPSATQLRELDPNDPFQGLTSKQQLFVMHSFSGMSDADAYRAAYDASGMTEKTLWGCAREVAQNPLVKAKIASLQVARDKQTTLAPGITREWVIQGIKEIATDSTAKQSTRLQAYIALGKTYAAPVFKEPEQSDAKPISTEDMDKRILELLRAGMATIDGVALDVTPAKEKAPGNSPAPASRKRKPRA